jgi:hypothetical protein
MILRINGLQISQNSLHIGGRGRLLSQRIENVLSRQIKGCNECRTYENFGVHPKGLGKTKTTTFESHLQAIFDRFSIANSSK